MRSCNRGRGFRDRRRHILGIAADRRHRYAVTARAHLALIKQRARDVARIHVVNFVIARFLQQLELPHRRPFGRKIFGAKFAAAGNKRSSSCRSISGNQTSIDACGFADASAARKIPP